MGIDSILGKDTLGMMRSIGIDMLNCLINTRDNFDRDSQIKILPAPILIIRPLCPFKNLTGCFITTYLNVKNAKSLTEKFEKLPGNALMDENSLNRITH